MPYASSEQSLWGAGGVFCLQFAKSCETQQGVANLPSLSHFTVHFPQYPPPGSVSHSTPDVTSPPDLNTLWKTTTLSYTNRCHMHAALTVNLLSFLSFLSFFWLALNVPSLGSIIIPMESLLLIDRRDITYRQMSTVITNWPLVCVPNTMFCKEGRDCVTAITFSGGSQCANRLCESTPPLGNTVLRCALEIGPDLLFSWKHFTFWGNLAEECC